MNRWGYIALVALILALGLYLFAGPRGAESAFRPVWSGSIPDQYQVDAAHGSQRVDGAQVEIHGMLRPLDPAASRRLWQTLSSLRADRFREVDAADLAAYGIGSWRVHGEGVDLRWGHRDQQAYLYNGIRGELAVLARSTYDALSRVAGRLDQRALLAGQGELRALRWQTHQVQRAADGSWQAVDNPARPPFDGRVGRFAEVLSGLRLEQWLADHDAEQGSELLRLSLMTDRETWQDLIVYDYDDQRWLQVGDLPPQPLDPYQWRSLHETVQAFATDPLFDIPLQSIDPTVERVEIWRNDAWWISVESAMNPTRDERHYSVLWEGGREAMSTRAAWHVQQSLNELLVDSPQPAATPLSQWLEEHRQPGQDHVHLRAWGAGDQLLAEFHLQGQAIRSRHFQGQLVAVPELFAQLGPASFIDRRLLSVSEDRVVKMQRVEYGGNGADGAHGAVRAEVYQRGERGWQQTLPRGATFNPLALERVLRSVLAAEGQALRLQEQPAGDPVYSLALRIAGQQPDSPRHDLDLEQTLDRDWGVTLYPRIDGDFDAVLADGTMVYHLAADTVGAWFAPLQEYPVIPVFANEILAIRVSAADSLPYLLRRNSDGQWFLRQDDDEQAADITEVRRYLADLSRLQAVEQDRDAAILSADESEHQITLTVPGSFDERDRIQLLIGREEGGQRWLSVQREGSQLTSWGRMRVPAADLNALLGPSRRFALPDAQP